MVNRIELKNFIKENFITLIFVIMILISIIATNQDGYIIIDNLVNKVMGFTLITIALILPIRVGMGFNFSIVVGAIAAQLGIIIAVSLESSGFLGIIFTVTIATILALTLGYIVGLLLNKARGHEMITSLFISYVANGFYQYILLFLAGSIIPIKASELLLADGTGIRNTIDLKSTLFKSFDGILVIPAFSLLFIASVGFLVFFILKLRKDKSYINVSGIISSFLCFLISGMIIFTKWLPYEVMRLKTIKLPILSVIIILAIILCYEFLIKDRITLSSTEANSNFSFNNVRIMTIVLSTVLAAWGQIVFLQNRGILITYGSHLGISLFAISTLIIGGGTLKNASVKNAIIGLILTQAFYVIVLPLFDSNISAIVQTIIMNSIYVYVFTKNYSKLNHLELKT